MDAINHSLKYVREGELCAVNLFIHMPAPCCASSTIKGFANGFEVKAQYVRRDAYRGDSPFLSQATNG